MRASLVQAEEESAVLKQWLDGKSEAILQAETNLMALLKEWNKHD